MGDKQRPYRAVDQENATEPPPKAVRRIAARNQRARDRLSNPLNRVGERPIDKIRDEQATARQEYGVWSPPAFIKRQVGDKPLKRCVECKQGRHCRNARVCICRCPK